MKPLLISLALLASMPAWARAESDHAQNEIFAKLRELTVRCVVQTVRRDPLGQKVLGELKSTCPELIAETDGARAQLPQGEVLAFLTESEEADGGDLNHLWVVDDRGWLVLELRNVPAFGDVFLALAGGNRIFREIDEL